MKAHSGHSHGVPAEHLHVLRETHLDGDGSRGDTVGVAELDVGRDTRGGVEVVWGAERVSGSDGDGSLAIDLASSAVHREPRDLRWVDHLDETMGLTIQLLDARTSSRGVRPHIEAYIGAEEIGVDFNIEPEGVDDVVAVERSRGWTAIHCTCGGAARAKGAEGIGKAVELEDSKDREGRGRTGTNEGTVEGDELTIGTAARTRDRDLSSSETAWSDSAHRSVLELASSSFPTLGETFLSFTGTKALGHDGYLDSPDTNVGHHIVGRDVDERGLVVFARNLI